jgi:hypothetical protein
VTKVSSSSRLYVDDFQEVASMCRAENSNESEVIREIVHDWLRIKKVEALGRDQIEDPVRRIYERVLAQQIEPLHDAI